MKLDTCATSFYRRDFACLITFWRRGVWWRLASQFKLCLNCQHWKYLSFPPCDMTSWKLDNLLFDLLIWIALRQFSFLRGNIQAIKN